MTGCKWEGTAAAERQVGVRTEGHRALGRDRPHPVGIRAAGEGQSNRVAEEEGKRRVEGNRQVVGEEGTSLVEEEGHRDWSPVDNQRRDTQLARPWVDRLGKQAAGRP